MRQRWAAGLMTSVLALALAPALPAAGMGAIPEQLAAGLVEPARLGVRALSIHPGDRGPSVSTDSGPLSARAVVVATDPTTAGHLPGLQPPAMKGLTTFWFAADEPPHTSNLLVVDGGGRAAGPVINAAVMSRAAPSYAPPGMHLIQASALLREGSDVAESDVRRQLAGMFGVDTDAWQLVIRHDIRSALPGQPPPLHPRQPVDLGDGLFVAGDWRDTASIQGALVSGRRAANAVTRYLRSPGPLGSPGMRGTPGVLGDG